MSNAAASPEPGSFPERRCRSQARNNAEGTVGDGLALSLPFPTQKSFVEGGEMKTPILILSALEAECVEEENLYGAGVLASALHYLITGRTFSALALGKEVER